MQLSVDQLNAVKCVGSNERNEHKQSMKTDRAIKKQKSQVTGSAEADVRLLVERCVDFGHIRQLWLEFEQRVVCSFFQSWCWVGTWLASISCKFEPILVRVVSNEEDVAIAVLIAHRYRRRLFVSSTGLFIGTTGDPHYDSITVEHGGPLLQPSVTESVKSQFLDALDRLDLLWDEVCLPGLNRAQFDQWTRAGHHNALRVHLEKCSPTYTVDLTALNDFDDYLASLSANTRQQIRRAIRGYEQFGKIEYHVASTTSEAHSFFHELIALHQRYWEAKGRRGAFGSEYQNAFHRDLITNSLQSGNLQLLRFSAGNHVIGFLHNFLWQERVYSYQSGFFYPAEDSKLKPGLVCHALAIDLNRRLGLSVYDFLAGESRYKKSLATREDEMYWIALRKRRLRFMLEEWLTSAYRHVRPKMFAG